MERAWDTFQDRLVSEMRLAGTATIEQANRMLRDFATIQGVAPAQPGSAYRQLAPGVSLDAALCFKYLRTVNTVHFNGAALQVLPDGQGQLRSKSRFDWTAASWSLQVRGLCTP